MGRKKKEEPKVELLGEDLENTLVDTEINISDVDITDIINDMTRFEPSGTALKLASVPGVVTEADILSVLPNEAVSTSTSGHQGKVSDDPEFKELQHAVEMFMSSQTALTQRTEVLTSNLQQVIENQVVDGQNLKGLSDQVGSVSSRLDSIENLLKVMQSRLDDLEHKQYANTETPTPQQEEPEAEEESDQVEETDNIEQRLDELSSALRPMLNLAISKTLENGGEVDAEKQSRWVETILAQKDKLKLGPCEKDYLLKLVSSYVEYKQK